ncbi:MAG: DMT family transporter [Clostridiales bacterium]|nr:DMT family transporter [Clostridiales bacterium]MDD7034685.1 DMT family transporter [Bacillota bacterium]MDY2919686.1 DMT family transporter [Lentihominibacter sp.]
MKELTKASRKGPLLAIIGVNFIWGFDFIAIEYLMDYMPAPVLTMMRAFIGAAVLLIWCLVKKGGMHIKRADWPRVFIAGGIGFSIYFSIESYGTGLTSASFSSLIMATVPIFGMIGDRIFFGNRITPLKVVCVLASIGGVYLLVSGESMGINMKGFIAMIIAALLWAFYIIYVKPLYDKYDLPTLLCGLFVSSSIVSVPVAIFTTEPGSINITPMCMVIIVATAFVCIIGGEFAYIYAIGKLSVTMVSIFENVLPLTAVIFSFFIFGNMLSGIQIAGGLLIMASVTVMAIRGEGGEEKKEDTQ